MPNIITKTKNRFNRIILACCDDKLDKIEIKWLNKKVCVLLFVLMATQIILKNIEIKNINNLIIGENDFVFMLELKKK